MRLPRLKLSVGLRTLLISVAAFALGIGADRFYNRFDRLMTMAAHYGAVAEAERKNVEDAEKMLAESQKNGASADHVKEILVFHKNSTSSAAYCERLRSKCVRAAFLPFLPAQDDIPPSVTTY